MGWLDDRVGDFATSRAAGAIIDVGQWLKGGWDKTAKVAGVAYDVAVNDDYTAAVKYLAGDPTSAARDMEKAFGDVTKADGVGALAAMMNTVEQTIVGWGDSLVLAAQDFFWYLALIGLFFSILIPAVTGGIRGLGDLFTPVLKWIILTGLFFYLLSNGGEIFIQSVNWFIGLGEKQVSGGGGGGKLQALSIITSGLDIVVHAWNSSVGTFVDAWHKSNALGALAGAAVICFFMLLCAVALALILSNLAARFLVTIIGAYCYAYIGIIALSLGGHNLGRDAVIAYFRKAFAIGLQVLSMYLIVEAAKGSIDGIRAATAKNGLQLATIVGMVGIRFNRDEFIRSQSG